ncbi:hypothetical protein BRPE64_ACDS01410 [Caballeronia insecticola]|uniref:Uncharacterized protein n=1 Tax=Caballeronia insecticola TaxID=758793 RepID=R4WM29_9BURK|nr:hypothetical protein BRPE64_ACDS01410 [Caballeronia insecticola]
MFVCGQHAECDPVERVRGVGSFGSGGSEGVVGSDTAIGLRPARAASKRQSPHSRGVADQCRMMTRL